MASGRLAGSSTHPTSPERVNSSHHMSFLSASHRQIPCNYNLEKHGATSRPFFAATRDFSRSDCKLRSEVTPLPLLLTLQLLGGCLRYEHSARAELWRSCDVAYWPLSRHRALIDAAYTIARLGCCPTIPIAKEQPFQCAATCATGIFLRDVCNSR